MKKGVFVLLSWMLLLLLLVGVGVANAKAHNEEDRPRPPPPNSHWEDLRKLLNRAFIYLFPPKIDFRAGKTVEDGGVSVNENGNVKEAITKSLGKTKQMVEDSAKAAAQTLHPEL